MGVTEHATRVMSHTVHLRGGGGEPPPKKKKKNITRTYQFPFLCEQTFNHIHKVIPAHEGKFKRLAVMLRVKEKSLVGAYTL